MAFKGPFRESEDWSLAQYHHDLHFLLCHCLLHHHYNAIITIIIVS